MTTETKTTSEGKRLTAERNYGQRMRQLILAGYSNWAIARMLRREFPGCRATAASVATMRSRLRKEGYDVLPSRKAPKQRADYSHVNFSAQAVLPSIVQLAIEAIDAGFNKDDAAVWVSLNV